MGLFQGIDETKERRVQNVMIGGEAIDPEATYTVAGSYYTLQEQGDGYTMFEGAEIVAHDELPVDSEMLINYFTEELGGNVTAEQYGNPLGDGRITILTEEAQEPADPDVPTDPENPADPEKPSTENPSDQNGNNNQNGTGSGNNNSGSGNSSGSTVQTGDESNIYGLIAVMAAAAVAAGGTCIYVIRRRRMQ